VSAVEAKIRDLLLKIFNEHGCKNRRRVKVHRPDRDSTGMLSNALKVTSH